MPDAHQLPSLIRLIDDASEEVRTTVIRELSGFGDELESALRDFLLAHGKSRPVY